VLSRLPIHPHLRSLLIFLLALALTGCANSPLQRSSVEKLQSIEIITVATPAMEAPSFLQAGVKSGQLSLIPALIVEGEKKITLSPPVIQDFGMLVTEKMQRRLAQIPWWPKMTTHQDSVPENFVNPSGYWLRVAIGKYEIAPSPLKTVFAVARVSLERPYMQGEPLWVKQKAFSGIVHGGEKIDMDKLPDDSSQLRREIERAADWLAREIVADIQ
jgi:hypothetical protein